MKEIGGYFGLDVGDGRLPHPGAVPVNFGRGGLELILRVRKYRKVWLPSYICPSVPRFLDRIGVPHESYAINDALEPLAMPKVDKTDGFLYVNYFGVKNSYCRKLERSQRNLILDLTQAFHYVPRHADAFNSARKFFPVPDGGFVYFKDKTFAGELPTSTSFSSCEALLRRADGDIDGGYKAFKAASERFANLSVAQMSQLTRGMLSNLDIRSAYKQRISNYLYLSLELRDSNLLKFKVDDTTAPLVYPYMVENGSEVKKHLIKNKIFCPTYWPGVENMGESSLGFKERIVFIPLDQRYGCSDMRHVLNMIITMRK